MKLIANYQSTFERLTIWFSTVIRMLLNVLLLVILAALVIGVAKSGYDLATSLHKPLEDILQQILLDVVFILALVEVTITVLGYLKDGHVHVRYIVDTILIITLNEVVSLWFKKLDLSMAIAISIVILALGALRIIVVRFPNK